MKCAGIIARSMHFSSYISLTFDSIESSGSLNDCISSVKSNQIKLGGKHWEIRSFVFTYATLWKKKTVSYLVAQNIYNMRIGIGKCTKEGEINEYCILGETRIGKLKIFFYLILKIYTTYRSEFLFSKMIHIFQNWLTFLPTFLLNIIFLIS